MLQPLLALIRKDGKLFAVDKQAIVMSVVIPILIATILGWLDSSSANDNSNSKVLVLFVDQDRSPTSLELRKSLASRKDVSLVDIDKVGAIRDVSEGKYSSAIVVPPKFGSLAASAMSGGSKVAIDLFEDPSQPTEGQLAQAILNENASRVIAKQVFGDMADRGSPVDVKVQNVVSGKATWAQSAHDYSGFGLQGLLFFAVEAGVALARERRSGVWRRLKASPASINLILLSRGISSTILALSIILLMFCVGGALFGIRVQGSFFGFMGIAVSAAMMAATFGLLMSTLGNTETQSRAISILIIFLMLATGGAWFPLSKMPSIVQAIAEFFPVRWAVEGFDAMTWRGLPLAAAGKSISVLILFSICFVVASGIRFRRLHAQF